LGSQEENHLFGLYFSQKMREDYGYLLNAKWHRINISPALNISNDDLNRAIDTIIKVFRNSVDSWKSVEKHKIVMKNHF